MFCFQEVFLRFQVGLLRLILIAPVQMHIPQGLIHHGAGKLVPCHIGAAGGILQGIKGILLQPQVPQRGSPFILADGVLLAINLLMLLQHFYFLV